MSLFGSLYSGASGMLAQSRATDYIATNIANATTIGYKRATSSFHDLLGDTTNSSTLNSNAGGVALTKTSRVREAGNYQQTNSDTDLSITGNGMFIVSDTTDGSSGFLYTRAGQFSEDSEGILRNTAGFALYGYLTDTDGVTQGSGQGALVPVDLSLFETQYFETTDIDLSINLDEDDERINPHSASTAQQLPIDNLQSSYSRTLSVYDSTGQEQNLRFEYRRTIGPMAHFSSRTGQEFTRNEILVDEPDSITPAITNGDQLVISNGTDTLNVDFVNTAADTSANEANTVGDLIDVVNSYTGSGTEQLFYASIDENGQLLIQAMDPTATMDISGSSANVLGNSGFDFIQDPDAIADYTYEPDFDITATDYSTTVYPGQGDFPALTNTTNPNIHTWWEMSVIHTAADGTETTVTSGLLNFDGDGTLNADTDANGDMYLSLTSDDLPFVSTNGLQVEMSRTSQFSGDYKTIEFEQNGAPSGYRQDVIIEGDGTVSLQFTGDIIIPVYRIPLALFNNPDGLEYVDGTAFRVPANGQSGELSIVEADSNGGGSIHGSTLENSNVDLAQEFSGMIITQRVYSMNSQLIQAVNEMTQTLSQLK